MGDIRTDFANYVRYVLKAENLQSLTIAEPIGWDDDEFKLQRHKDYHGMFFNYTSNLKFKGNSAEYINQCYKVGGVNANLRITKYEKKNVNGTVKWIQKYTALADYKTMIIIDGVLNINFNSFDLAELIKSHESDDFEIERIESIDGISIDPLTLSKTAVSGRAISENGEATWRPQTILPTFVSSHIAPFTDLIAEGPDRHGPVLFQEFDDWPTVTADSMIYVMADFVDIERNVTLKWEMYFNMKNIFFWWTLHLRKVQFNEGTGEYDIIEEIELFNKTQAVDGYAGLVGDFETKGTYNTVMQYNQGLLFVFRFGGGNVAFPRQMTIFETPRSYYTINETSFADSSPSLDCIFYHDLIERLLYIITGEKGHFYSKYFGRTEINYLEDGPGGLIANINGFGLRAWDPTSERYKSLTTSLKDAMDSGKAVFNIGIGIESNQFQERLRFEDLKYFYRNETVVKFTKSPGKVEIKVDPNLLFSGTEFGYELGGDYEDENGLDEPNTRVNSITPIRKSPLKYTRVSKIRADDYAMELTRRKPMSLFPDEDTKRDDNIWWLDLQRGDFTNYYQRNWDDNRLQELPTGIHSPETWKGFLFTPQMMLFRHAWVFRAGLEPYLSDDYNIIYGSSSGNPYVKTWPVNRPEALAIKEPIKVNSLDRSRFLPEIITMEYYIDDELMDWILGTTEVEVEGQLEQVPNYYFKMEYKINDKIQSGYLLSLDPSGKGKVVFQSSNENLI